MPKIVASLARRRRRVALHHFILMMIDRHRCSTNPEILKPSKEGSRRVEFFNFRHFSCGLMLPDLLEKSNSPALIEVLI